MWLRLLRRLLPETINLESVNVIGSKSKVIEACKQDQKDDGRKKLYIVDGDFDYLTKKPMPRLKHLYRLQAYCVENLLCHPLCVTAVCLDYDGSVSIDNAWQRIEYERLIGRHEVLLRSLFVVYAAAQELSLGVETVKYSVHKLMRRNNKLHELDTKKVWSRIRSVIRASAAAVGLRTFSRKRKQLWETAKKIGFEKIVSGKHCLLPLLWLRMHSHHNYHGDMEDFKI